MKNNIISESFFSSISVDIGEKKLNAGPDMIGNQRFGNDLKYYLILTNHTDLIQNHISIDTESLYNSRYFYFVRFYKLYIIERGDDDGIYQMYMNLLENRPDALPWK